jgi:predicted RNase H-like HicB family nuclease
MRFVLVLHSDSGFDHFGVTVADLPGCFSAGDTLDEAFEMAKEAIAGHALTMLEMGLPIPQPKPLQEHLHDPDFADAALWGVVEVDLERLSGAVESTGRI